MRFKSSILALCSVTAKLCSQWIIESKILLNHSFTKSNSKPSLCTVYSKVYIHTVLPGPASLAGCDGSSGQFALLRIQVGQARLTVAPRQDINRNLTSVATAKLSIQTNSENPECGLRLAGLPGPLSPATNHQCKPSYGTDLSCVWWYRERHSSYKDRILVILGGIRP